MLRIIPSHSVRCVIGVRSMGPDYAGAPGPTRSALSPENVGMANNLRSWRNVLPGCVVTFGNPPQAAGL